MQLPSEFRRKFSKQQNRGNISYSVYHYYFPSTIIEKISFLRKYYKILTKCEHIPEQHKWRNFSCDFADDALEVMNQVRLITNYDDPVIIGSRFKSPIPWAIFGDSNVGVLSSAAKLKFPTFDNAIKHYGVMGNCTWQKVTIHHKIRASLSIDPIDALCFVLEMPKAYILTVAIGMLSDFILHSGPDADEFYHLFTNDKRHRPNEEGVIKMWQNLRKTIIPIGKDSPELVFHSIPQNKALAIIAEKYDKNKKQQRYSGSYSHVELEDMECECDILNYEKFVLHYEAENKVKNKVKNRFNSTFITPNPHHCIQTSALSINSPNLDLTSTFGELAEQWLMTQGLAIPRRYSEDWNAAYELWWNEIGHRVFSKNYNSQREVDEQGRNRKKQLKKQKRMAARAANIKKGLKKSKPKSGVCGLDLAEDWCKKEGIPIPPRNTTEWSKVYKRWWSIFQKTLK